MPRGVYVRKKKDVPFAAIAIHKVVSKGSGRYQLSAFCPLSASAKLMREAKPNIRAHGIASGFGQRELSVKIDWSFDLKAVRDRLAKRLEKLGVNIGIYDVEK